MLKETIGLLSSFLSLVAFQLGWGRASWHPLTKPMLVPAQCVYSLLISILLNFLHSSPLPLGSFFVKKLFFTEIK